MNRGLNKEAIGRRCAPHEPADFPPGITSAPFTWVYYNEKFNMSFSAGIVGVIQLPGTKALKPEVGWFVSEAPAKAPVSMGLPDQLQQSM